MYANPYLYNPNPRPYYNQMQLPQQQIPQVNGKASVDTIQLAPNSSILLMDTSAPLVWMCVSDSLGKVTATPYDIKLHEEKPIQESPDLEQRIARLEMIVAGMEGGAKNEPNAGKSEPKQNRSNRTAD